MPRWALTLVLRSRIGLPISWSDALMIEAHDCTHPTQINKPAPRMVSTTHYHLNLRALCSPTFAPKSTMLSRVKELACSAFSKLVDASRKASNELKQWHICWITTCPSLDCPRCRRASCRQHTSITLRRRTADYALQNTHKLRWQQCLCLSRSCWG